MRVRCRCAGWCALILLGTVVPLAACGGGMSGPASTPVVAPMPSLSGMPATVAPAPGTKSWVDLQVGECVEDIPAVEVGVTTVAILDCATPHRAEVFRLAPVAVNAAIADVASQACAAGVDQYTGGAPKRALSLTYLIDSEQDRTGAVPLPSTVICLLQAADGQPLRGSVRA
jgi:hypothetical protein